MKNTFRCASQLYIFLNEFLIYQFYLKDGLMDLNNVFIYYYECFNYYYIPLFRIIICLLFCFTYGTSTVIFIKTYFLKFTSNMIYSASENLFKIDHNINIINCSKQIFIILFIMLTALGFSSVSYIISFPWNFYILINLILFIVEGRTIYLIGNITEWWNLILASTNNKYMIQYYFHIIYSDDK